MSICAICVEDIGSPACCVPCGHVYCQDCIEEWRKSEKSASSCPQCRKTIEHVMALFIKREDTKDEVKLLSKKLEILNSEKIKLENDYKDSIADLKDLSDTHEKIVRKLKEEKNHSATYKEKLRRGHEWLIKRQENIKNLKRDMEDLREQLRTCTRKNINLQNKIQNMEEKEEKLAESKAENKKLKDQIVLSQEKLDKPCEFSLLNIWLFCSQFILTLLCIFDIGDDTGKLVLALALLCFTTLLLVYWFKPFVRRQLVFLDVFRSAIGFQYNDRFEQIGPTHYCVSKFDDEITRDPKFLKWIDSNVLSKGSEKSNKKF